MTPVLWVYALAMVAARAPHYPQYDEQHVTVKHYRSGIMERTVQIRLAQGYRLPTNVDGYVSRPECSTIGQVLYLRIAGSKRVYRLAQADCSQYRDKARHLRENIVEVGYDVAVSSGLVRDGRSTGTLWEAVAKWQ